MKNFMQLYGCLFALRIVSKLFLYENVTFLVANNKKLSHCDIVYALHAPRWYIPSHSNVTKNKLSPIWQPLLRNPKTTRCNVNLQDNIFEIVVRICPQAFTSQ